MTASTTSGTVEVTVRAVASGGDGVADLPDGRVVFVPRTAPGDRARITIEQDRSSWARASLVELLEEGDVRVEAPCPLFDECGGCQLQHLPYSAQLDWKARFVVDALERIGKLTDVPTPEVVPSPRSERYRARMTFTLRRLRGGRVVAGLYALARPGHVVDIDDECLLPRQPVLDAWTSLRSRWGSGAHRLPDGGQLRLLLRSVPEGVELLVDGGAPGWRSGGLLDDVPELVGIWHRPSDRDDAALVAGRSAPGRGDAFEQVNPEGADLLHDHVLGVARRASGLEEAVGAADGSPPRVVDAYCGAAAVGRTLTSRGCRVTGIERNASAVAAARDDAPEGFEVVEGEVERHLAGTLPADLLIVNPPRSGLDDAIPAMVRAEPPPRIVYVSCDPATLARDVGRFGDGWSLADLRCFDLFPHTAHVETVALLERAGAGV